MISTHILDLTTGLTGKDVTVSLSKKQGDHFNILRTARTDSDGRISFDVPSEAGIYQLHFATDDYFEKQNKDPFFTDPLVTFNVTDTNRKYHIPLLLNQFGYSTYRGS